MNKTCVSCGQLFGISQTDLDYYKKASLTIGDVYCEIPPPTYCPDCRQQRRLAWRNERFLYHRRCDLSGKTFISNFAPGAPVKVYGHQEWWSDAWDARNYGRGYDFNQPFFQQYAELQAEAPCLGIAVWNSQNSDYCNYVGNVKNCYLIFGPVYSEDCYYGSPYYSKDCLDTLVVRECERCYECIDCRKLHSCFYCQDCHSSSDLWYCYDLQGCSECIGCAGLRNKKYCMFNEQLPEDKYQQRKKELDLCDDGIREKLQIKLEELKLAIPHRYMQSNNAQNASGNYVYQGKNIHYSFYADRAEDCAYCAQVVDLKDCFDNNYTEENELCCEYIGAYQNNRTSFSKFCNLVNDALYCDACHSSRNIFGCISLRNSQYCILNKQYTKEEYEALVPKIVSHMRKTGEWGQFFPINLSPFGYNETVAQEYFYLNKDQAIAKGWNWRDEEPGQEKYLGPTTKVDSDINKIDDGICEKILQCQETGKLFRIIEKELRFYREMHLPVPKTSPNARHARRLKKRNPRRLWNRTCAKCGKEIQTSYSSNRPEIVYCDDCYLSVVY